MGNAWNYPVVIVAAVVGALAFAVWLMRLAGYEKHEPPFECDVCGHKDRGVSSRDWRYCPYCGVPRGGKLSDLPSRHPRF